MFTTRIFIKNSLKCRNKFLVRLSSSGTFKSDVVICGGGLTGLSLSYHLAKRGASVYLFERGCIGAAGASSICTGIMTAPCFWWDSGTHKIVENSMKLYERMAQDYSINLTKCGRVYLAQSDTTVNTANRMYSRAKIWNDSAELIEDPLDVNSRWPMINSDDVKLAFYSPDDVSLDPIALCHALKNEAIKMGAQIFENTPVKYVLIGEGDRVYAVETEAGLIETKNFVNAAGIWANMMPVKNLLNQHVRVAVHPCTYTFLHTEKLPQMGLSETTPIFVDLDNSLFVRATEYGTSAAGFLESSITSLGLPNDTSGWHMPPIDWDKFYPVLKSLLHRCPSLGQCSRSDLISGAEAYTPDGYPIVGESEQAKGYFVANGMNGRGLALSGGVGQLLANWILDGFSQIDISKVDATRFIDMHLNMHYLHERCPEVASNTFKPFHYSHQSHTARNLRMCPIYYKLRDAGAVFGEIMGYERPLWFKVNTTGTRTSLHSGLDFLSKKSEWFPCVAREYEACRERVGLIDMSSFSKFEVKGHDALKFLQRLCSANVDRPVGTTIYTGMQNERGGYVTDCTMSRIADDHYFIVAPTIQQLRCMVWMRKWINTWKMHVDVQDVTSLYTALNIVGPSSRYLMQDVTGRSMSSTDFPTFQCRLIDVGYATNIRAISITHCGELGWMAQHVYEKIIEEGQEYGLLHAGYYTLRHLRIEKFYVYWGQDIDASTTPVECGRTFRVDFKKDFLGKQALVKQMETGVSKRFVQLLVDKHDLETDPWPQGSEIIYRDGKMAGWTTSAAYGFTLGCPVCIGYLENENFGISPEFVNNGFYEVDIANRRFPVRVNLHSPSLPMISSEHPMHYRPTQ